jgi:hypothetical protein
MHTPLSFNGFREISVKNTGSSSPVIRKQGLSTNDKVRFYTPTAPETAYFRPFLAKIIPSMSKPEFINRWYQLWQNYHKMIEMHTPLPTVQRLQSWGCAKGSRGVHGNLINYLIKYTL